MPSYGNGGRKDVVSRCWAWVGSVDNDVLASSAHTVM